MQTPSRIQIFWHLFETGDRCCPIYCVTMSNSAPLFGCVLVWHPCTATAPLQRPPSLADEIKRLSLSHEMDGQIDHAAWTATAEAERVYTDEAAKDVPGQGTLQRRKFAETPLDRQHKEEEKGMSF